MNRNKL